MIPPLRRLAAALAASAFLGCGGGDTPTTVPANPPPIPVDDAGKPKPPPTAAGDVKPIRAQP